MGSILWLASYPKSGNTWLRAFLANLVADRVTPLKPSELSEYGEAEASADRYTELSGRSSTTLVAEELAALRLPVHALVAQHARGTQLGCVNTNG